MDVTARTRLVLAAFLGICSLTSSFASPCVAEPLDRTIGPGRPLGLVALPGGDLAIAEMSVDGAPSRGRVRRIDRAGESVWVRELPGVDLAPRPAMSLIYGKLIALAAKTHPKGPAPSREWTGMLKLDGALAAYKAVDDSEVKGNRDFVRLKDGSHVTVTDQGGADGKRAIRVIVRGGGGVVRVEAGIEDAAAGTPQVVAALADGGFLVAWTALDSQATPEDQHPEVARYAGDGKRLWIAPIAGLPKRALVTVASALVDGRIAVGGATGEPPDAFAHPAWAATLDADGRTVSTALFGPTGRVGELKTIAPLMDGGVAHGGCADLVMTSERHPWIVLIGPDGRVRREIKRLRLGGGNVTGLAAMEDGGLAAVGVRGGVCAGLPAESGAWLMVFPQSDIAVP